MDVVTRCMCKSRLTRSRMRSAARIEQRQLCPINRYRGYGPAGKKVRTGYRRDGVAILELLAVISMLAVVMSITGMIFHLLMRSEKLVTQSFVTERAISRIAIQFRNDVHLSTLGTLSSRSNGTPDELALGDDGTTRVKYRVTREGLTRLQFDRDGVTVREDFRLPECQVRLTPGTETDPTLRTLVIARPGAAITRNPSAPRPLRALEIHARLGRYKSAISLNSSRPAEAGEADVDRKTEEQPQ